MISGYLLMLGFFSPVEEIVIPLPEYSKRYEYRSDCEQSLEELAITESYKPIIEKTYGKNTFRIWCEPIKRK